MRGRPTKDPHTRPAINTLERLHMELGGQILANRQQHDALNEQMRHVEAASATTPEKALLLCPYCASEVLMEVGAYEICDR